MTYPDRHAGCPLSRRVTANGQPDPCDRISPVWGVYARATFFCWLATLLLMFPSASHGQDPRQTAAAGASVESSVDQPIKFSASDSLVLFIRGEKKSGVLYGNSSIQMNNASLRAHRIDILFDRDELRANGLREGGEWIGKPEFIQGADVFEGEVLAYNFETERGRVVGAQTQYQEGFIRGGVVKSRVDDVLFIQDGVYTTCNCVEDPSYSLRSGRMKLVDKKWIYTGPLQLYLFNIPTPLWLPFGFLPAQDTRRSGPLPPTYGEDEFGFYLRDWGWYFALNDYLDLQLQGGFWTRGSWEGRSLFRYNKRYHFSGQLQLSFARFRSGESRDPTYSVRKTGSFRWTHNQTLDPTATFNANVNLSSSSYLRGVSQNYDDRTRQTIQSTLRLSKRWRSRNLSLQVAHNQVLATDEVSLTFPTLTFSQSSFKPFSRESRPPGQSERFYEKVTLGYNFNLDNRFTFRPRSLDELIAAGDSSAADISWFDALTSRSDYQRATGKDEQFDFKATHRIPVSAPFSVERLPLLGTFRLNITPSLNYSEDWYVSTERRSLSADSSGFDSKMVPGFFAFRQLSTSVGATTTFYGLFPIRIGPYQSIRHTVRPSVSFTYRPDYFADSFGYTRTYRNASGEEVRYSIVTGVGSGKQESINFGINNTFETKRISVDTTGVASGNRPVKLLDLQVSSAYNFAADSFKFSDVRLTARTRLFGQVDVDFRSTFSPYKTDEDGRRIDKYAFSPTSPLGRLTRADFTVRTSLRSGIGDGSRPMTSPRAGMRSAMDDPMNPTSQFYQDVGPTDYADFSIPWSLSLDFSYGVTKTSASSIRRAILNTSFDFSLTPNWKVASRTGFDFEAGELVTTSLSLARDFDCWQMSFNWIPFGDYQSWGFDLHVKSSHLRDLLRIQHPRSDVRDRFGSLQRGGF